MPWVKTHKTRRSVFWVLRKVFWKFSSPEKLRAVLFTLDLKNILFVLNTPGDFQGEDFTESERRKRKKWHRD